MDTHTLSSPDKIPNPVKSLHLPVLFTSVLLSILIPLLVNLMSHCTRVIWRLAAGIRPWQSSPRRQFLGYSTNSGWLTQSSWDTLYFNPHLMRVKVLAVAEHLLSQKSSVNSIHLFPPNAEDIYTASTVATHSNFSMRYLKRVCVATGVTPRRAVPWLMIFYSCSSSERDMYNFY